MKRCSWKVLIGHCGEWHGGVGSVRPPTDSSSYRKETQQEKVVDTLAFWNSDGTDSVSLKEIPQCLSLSSQLYF